MADDDLEASLDLAGALTDTLDGLEARSRAFGAALTSALKGAALEGNGLNAVLASIATRFSSIALDAGLAPLQSALSSGVSSLTQTLTSATAYAKGGVVNGPTYFGAGDGLGLMGEAGAEAILPLSHGADGRLGVAGAGGGTQIVFNVQATDAASFRRSEQQINAMLARAAARGRRGV
ncbi:phage tail tape measure protein [Rhizobium sp. G21]|uniref:phage tail tape measure protein n=1 Tax=Rhizobium sp. G21 TaxID=2758439 RepID=UPI0016018BE0|nr:phage tail tape measure protein [Rhizobium sp. G21]MBB1248280.1 phage tail tape measure protein [Rhizobium sp. G21]